MRKFVSATIVCAMMLTLFLGLFGGVVEEVSGTVSVIGTTIYIDDFETLATVDGVINNNAIFEYDFPSQTAIAHYNININGSGTLIINPGETIKFDSGRFLYVNGILDAEGLPDEPITFTSSNPSPSPGDWDQITFNDTISSSSRLSYVNVNNGTIGIYCNNSSPTIIDSRISDNSENGIYLKDSSPILASNRILNNGQGFPLQGGIYFENSILIIENSSISNPLNDDYIITGSTDFISLNSTFNSISTFGGAFQYTVNWFFEILVKDNVSGDPIPGAMVQIEDNAGTPIVNSPFTTDNNGYVRWINITDYTENSGGRTDYNPYNISVTHNEYYSNITSSQIDAFKKVAINLDMIRRDLTTNQENITFSPGGIAVAGEDVTIYVKIHNIEVDDAENVRVVIEDNAPEGPLEIHNSTISLIEGKDFKNAIDVWQPTPGIHTIEVNIDPFNEINEINSDSGINAETNNYAEEQLSVNSRPLINITAPLEYSEVNETITIQGTAYDDIADIDVINGSGPNEIERVDIRLEGHDWIELTWPNVFPNGTGYWGWQYDWDTTQWDGIPLDDGNYTIQARAWDNYHYSFLDKVPITVNNTGANAPPSAVISSPLNFSTFNVNQVITFDGSESNDTHTAPENLIYTWDFDDTVDTDEDGDFTNDVDATGNITTHAYNKKGFFDVTLIVWDEGGLNDTVWITIEIWNYLPVADITTNSTTVYENDTVEFNGSASYDPDGVITTFSWDFDDGSPPITGYFPIVDHQFNESRIFNVTLTVIDNNGTYNLTWILIDVLPNEAPNAVINEPLEAQRFDVNETIVFNASGSTDVNDADLKYLWDFGDGTDSGWLDFPVTTYNYSQYGPNVLPYLNSYAVTLSVKDDEDLADTEIVNIIVNNYPPVAIAISNKTSADTYEDISFDGTGSYDPNDAIATYLWDFDDGTTAITPTATHQFEQDGVYNVTLTVVDGFNANDTDWIIILIANRVPVIVNVTVDPSTPVINEEITITIDAVDEDGTIVKYFWSFGDGADYFENTTVFPDGAFDGVTTHTYTSRSSYTVLIEVTDDDTLTNSTFIIITLVNAVPEVTITDPSQNETVAEITTISGTSTDRDGSVSLVQVKIDDGNWIEAQDTSSDDSWSTWSYDWDTEDGYVNGDHMIYARAYDDEDYTDPPANVTVTVDNLPTSITATINLDPETVEEEGNVSVFGTVTYNTGDPVEDALINVTIFNEVGGWETTTSSGGSYTVDITAPDTSGNYRVYVDAEKDSFTDTQYQFLTVTPLPEKPDLTLTTNDIDFNPSAPFSGDTVQITITVYNIGDSNANNVLVNVYDGNPQTGGTSIGSKTTSVPANGQTDVIVDWATTGITGTFTVNVILDPNDDIEEGDESNNQAQKPITITGKPDFTLEAADITFSKESPSVGDPISILIRIFNDGAESGTVNYKVYAGDPDLGGILIDSKEETISKDDDKTVIVQWTPEEGGDYDIYVVLDPDDDVDEIDEDNNEAYATITVEKESEDGGFPTWMLYIMIALVFVVVIIMLIFYLRSKGPRKPRPQRQELPLAQVVQSEPKKQAKKVAAKDEEEKEVEGLMGGSGGIRIG